MQKPLAHADSSIYLKVAFVCCIFGANHSPDRFPACVEKLLGADSQGPSTLNHVIDDKDVLAHWITCTATRQRQLAALSASTTLFNYDSSLGGVGWVSFLAAKNIFHLRELFLKQVPIPLFCSYQVPSAGLKFVAA